MDGDTGTEKKTIHDLPVELLDLVLGHGHPYDRLVHKNVCQLWRRRLAQVVGAPTSGYYNPNRGRHVTEETPPPCFIAWAVQRGHKNLIGWAHSSGCPLTASAAVAALDAGRFDLFLWLVAERGCPWRKMATECAEAAARANLVEAIDWIVAERRGAVDWRRVAVDAAERGHLAVLQRLPLRPRKAGTYVARCAARNGHLEVLRWAFERGYPIDHTCAKEAAGRGDMDMLRWLDDNGLPIGRGACASAAAGGRLEVLRWLRERGCPWGQTSLRAAAAGHAHVIHWAIGAGCPWNPYASVWAAMEGHLDLAEWCIGHGCPLVTERDMDAGLYDHAAAIAMYDPLDLVASEGRIDIMGWLIARGCRVTKSTIVDAADEGRFGAVQWLNDHHRPWNADVCASLAKRGNLDALRYVRERGCPWDERVCVNAAREDHVEVLEWAVCNGCPWDPRRCLRDAADGMKEDAVRWIESWMQRNAFGRASDDETAT
jgi:hypothetical protein